MSAGELHPVAGDTFEHQVIHLAGVLAEAGVKTVVVNGIEHRARATDLPGLLRASQVGAELRVQTPALRAHLASNGWAYQTADPALARRLSGDR